MNDVGPPAAFSAVALAAQAVLRRAGTAEDLLEQLLPAVRADGAAVRAMLAERLYRRLTAALATARPSAVADPARGRRTCSDIADEILKDATVLTHLAKWLSVNMAFWLWRGDAVESIDAVSVAALIAVFADNQAQIVGDSLSPPRASLSQLEEILGVTPPLSATKGSPVAIPAGMMLALSEGQFQMLREALSLNRFGQRAGSLWPTAALQGGGIVQLRPPAADGWLPQAERDALADTMWRQQRALSDRDADVLDALCSLYLTRARHPDEAVTAEVDDLLDLRGLKSKRGGGGRRGGYEVEQRAVVMDALTRIQNLWLDIAEQPDPIGGPERPSRTLQSRPFVVTDRVGRKHADGSFDTERFVFRPGRAFAAFLFDGARHLMFAQALRYDPYRHAWEKRLTRYFCWQWGEAAVVGDGHAHPVKRLLAVASGRDDRLEHGKTRARLEKALARLRHDGVLAAWRYDSEPPAISRRGWWEGWCAAAVIVDAPASLRRYYAGALAGGGKCETDGDDLGQRLRHHRRRRGLAQMALARRLGITQGQVSKLETGTAAPSEPVRRLIEEWLAEPD